MNTAQLRAFHAVAEAGGFSAAARRLGVTQPAITFQLRAIEDGYGVTLFHRRGRRVVPTETGVELHAFTKRIFALHDQAQALLEEEGQLKRGRLRVGADAPHHVMAILSKLRAEHPGLDVSVSVGNSEEVQASLLEYRTDVAVLAGFEDDARFTAVTLGRHPIVVFVAKAHRWSSREGLKIAELHGEPMIMRERGSATRRAFEAALRARQVAPQIVMEMESREAVHEAVAWGMGFGVVLASEAGSDDRVRLLPLDDAPIHTEESIVCLAERDQTRSLRTVFRIAREMSRSLSASSRPGCPR